MQEIDFLMSVRGKNTVRITLPMVKQEHILLASSTLAELSDELLDISKKKYPLWQKIYRSRLAVTTASREIKMLAEPESLGNTYKGDK